MSVMWKKMKTTSGSQEESREDTSGLYYIFEHGKLRCSSGKQTDVHHARPSCSPVCVPPLTSSTEVLPLRTLCLNFTAHNIHLVESLVGFPEIIAEELFEFVVKTGNLRDLSAELARKILKLFNAAYDCEVLSSLFVDGSVAKQPVAYTASSVPLLLTGLRALDLRGCSLSSDHRLLQHIGRLIHLEVLGLKETRLTDVDLRKLTTPLRVMKQGPAHLTTLQLAGNPGITDGAIGFIVCFKHLSTLDLSDTSVTSVGVGALLERGGLRLSSEPLDEFSGSLCETRGWAADVVNDWYNTDVVSPTRVVQPSQEKGIHSTNFYKRKTRNSMIIATCSKSKVLPCTHFRKVASSEKTTVSNASLCKISVDASESKHSGANNRISKADKSLPPVQILDKCHRSSSSKKRKHNFDVDDEMTTILHGYSVTESSQPKKTSLLDALT